jgi:uncharacterized repeat protein (TIGR03803 family)
MRDRRAAYAVTGTLAMLALVAMLAGSAWAKTNSTTVIYSFAGDEDGEYPSTELVRDSAGNLYGTSVLGGDFGSGTVFEVSPSGTHTILYSFTSGADGGQPYGGVTLDAEGNLYGTAVTGGSGGACEGGCGVAYKLTNVGGTWTQGVLHNFTGGDDGSGPGAGLTLDAQGNLYGMTPTGGAYGFGTIYQLHPKQQGGRYRFRVVHAFTGGVDGSSASVGRLIFDPDGNLYGAATVGGAYGNGVVFQLHQRDGSWKLRTLYSFMGKPNAGFPYGGLVFDGAGNLYGTTYYDGANDFGSVYQLAPRLHGSWKERVLYSFQNGTDGAFSISNLVFDADGNLYGTTSEGGAPGCSCGTVFKMTHNGPGQWTESVEYAFTGTPDGAFPYNGLVGDGAGNFYGTTVHGGADNEGSVYEFRP